MVEPLTYQDFPLRVEAPVDRRIVSRSGHRLLTEIETYKLQRGRHRNETRPHLQEPAGERQCRDQLSRQACNFASLINEIRLYAQGQAPATNTTSYYSSPPQGPEGNRSRKR